MPLYEYQCPTCGTRFEALRPMSRADEPASCPHGHPGSTRVLSVFASGGRSTESPSPPPGSGGHGHSQGPGTHTH